MLVEDKGGVSTRQGKNAHLRLELDKWVVAWDAFAIAGCILEQFSYSNAMAHKASVLEVRKL